MALPPKDLHLTCQKCGADREIELAVHAFTAPALASARRWILALGGLYLLGAFVLYAQYGDYLTDREKWLILGPGVALAAIQGGLWLWAAVQPFAAALVGLALFVTLQLVTLVVSPASVFQGGLLLKVFQALFLVTLGGAVHAGYKARQIRAKYARSAGQKSGFDLYVKKNQ